MGAYSNLGDLSTAQVVNADVYSEYYIDMAVTIPKLGVGQHAPYLCIRTAVIPTDLADSLSIEVRCSGSINAGDLDGAIKTSFMALAGVANAGGGINEVIANDARLATAGAWIFQGPLPYQVNLRYLQLYYNNTIDNGQFVIDAWLNDGPASEFRGSQVIKSTVGQP